jgi:histidyl-tRNA synthetase
VEPRPSASPSSPLGCGGRFIAAGYEELIVPAIWEQQTFVAKAGAEIVDQMYTFADKKGRPICLIPEVTGLIQDQWRDSWSKSARGPCRVFYVARCYRYERPQAGRYREFTQVGVELLGGRPPDDRREVEALLVQLLDEVGAVYELDRGVERGLSYYTEDGFEALCPRLGAQKQIAGGGRYAEGIGWAIGLDRLLLALAPTEDGDPP